jgi:uncharacterized protein (TIGR02147 family)
MAQEQMIFDFIDYKAFLRFKVGAKSARRGLKTALAKALSCQPTYISQVINGHAQLSLEQAHDLNEFFGFSHEESHYFLLLVQKDRAGKASLKKYFSDQLQQILDHRLNLTRRLGTQNTLSDEQKSIFYGSWHYLAIYLALTIPQLRHRETLARHFQLPLKKVNEVLDFLVGCGLAKQVGDTFASESGLIRIGNDSPHILRHHTNWRLQALESLDREDVHDLHYSAVYSLSRADIRKLKNQMLEHIKEYLAVVKDSPEEEIYVLGLDFFNLKSARD